MLRKEEDGHEKASHKSTWKNEEVGSKNRGLVQEGQRQKCPSEGLSGWTAEITRENSVFAHFEECPSHTSHRCVLGTRCTHRNCAGRYRSNGNKTDTIPALPKLSFQQILQRGIAKLNETVQFTLCYLLPDCPLWDSSALPRAAHALG